METKPILNRWKLFILWVLVNTIGMIVAAPIITVLIISIITSVLGLVMRVILHPASLTPPLAPNELSFITQGASIFGVLITILSIIIPSLLLGIFQWFVLRTQIADSRKWIMVSFIGLSIGLSIGIFGWYLLIFRGNPPSIASGVLSGGIGAIIGAMLGIAQWSFLRKHVRFSSLWILGSIVSCSIATNTAWGWPSFLGFVLGDDTGFSVIFGFIFLIIRFMVIYSITSGIMLTWMLNRPTKELPMATTA